MGIKPGFYPQVWWHQAGRRNVLTLVCKRLTFKTSACQVQRSGWAPQSTHADYDNAAAAGGGDDDDAAADVDGDSMMMIITWEQAEADER